MKLFLASQDLGNFATILQAMVGKKKRALVISNARDYYNDEARIAGGVEKTLVNLGKIGIEAERLDLRPFFGKQSELARYIEEKQAGLIFSVGGNVICLATALHESGMDEIIRQGVAEDRFVYGGYSAGSMVASHNLSLYLIDAKSGEELPLCFNPDVTKEIYGVESYRQGLGLIPEYVVPHMDRSDCIDVMRKGLNKTAQAGAEAICLDDADVFVVNDENKEILKG